MLITAEEYIGMGFPEVNKEDLEGCLMRSEYIISALTDGKAEKTVQSGGKPAELVKQAAGFQTYKLLREMQTAESFEDSSSDSEKVSIGDYSYSTQTSKNSSSQTAQASDCDEAGLNAVRLLRAAGCLYPVVEVFE